MEKPFTPSFKWHLTVVCIFVFICTGLLLALRFSSSRWPRAYKPATPPAEVMPWKH